MSKDARAWVFKTDLPWLDDIKRKLDAVSPSPWAERDCEWRPDSISNLVTEDAGVQIHGFGRGVFVASVFLRRDSGGGDTQLEAGKARLFADVLPVIGARDVQETEPVE
jgi:hypothetical protein